MSVPELFIRRPVMTTLVMAAILLFGLVGFRQLPVSDLPSVDYPTISVSASLPGASPQTMASAVATPLEKQFSTIAGVDSMSSVSSVGSASITIQFSLDRNIDAAAEDVNAAIAKAAKQLPVNMPSPPTYQKVNPADSPIIFLAMSSPTLPISDVDNYAENLLAEQISQINGVAQVGVFGAAPYAVRIQVDPNRLAAYGLGIDQVEQAVEAGNVNQPLGTLYGKHQAFTVQANGQLENAAAFRPMIVAYRNGNPVRLQQLGNVLDSVQNNKSEAWYDSTPAVVLAVQRQPGANTVEVVDNIKKLLPQFRAAIPASVNLDILIDRSLVIRKSVSDVEHTLFHRRVSRGHGHFCFSAEPFGDANSKSRAADVHHRHLRGDGAAQLQPRQSFAHGAHAVRRVRRGRRHRHARKYRAPHGNGRAGDGGRAQRLARNRLHNHFNDALALCGVHSDPVHERTARAAAARICRDDCRGGFVFRFRFIDADADDVQPFRAFGKGEKAREGLQCLRAFLRPAARRLRPHVANRHAPSRADDACVAGDFRGNGVFILCDSERLFS
jgi:hypothetical protein